MINFLATFGFQKHSSQTKHSRPDVSVIYLLEIYSVFGAQKLYSWILDASERSNNVWSELETILASFLCVLSFKTPRNDL